MKIVNTENSFFAGRVIARLSGTVKKIKGYFGLPVTTPETAPEGNEQMIRRFGATQCYIYCSGKAGSMTLYNTMARKYRCLHVHNNMHFQIEIAKTNQISIFDCINLSKLNYDKVWLIDSYRLPVERAISSFFQNLENFISGEEMMLESERLLSLMSERLDKRMLMESYHSINEVMQYYKVPLFESFNFERGYNIRQQDNLVFIKLRFAEINQWERILSEIFGKKIRVQSSNMSNEKTYSALYSLFKEFYRVPAWAYNRMINTREFRIYNSESEKEMYDAKWRNRLKD